MALDPSHATARYLAVARLLHGERLTGFDAVVAVAFLPGVPWAFELLLA